GNHWAAVSHHASAHILSDQGVEFDEQRPATARDRYFVPYLVCWLQRLFLEGLREATAGILSRLAADRDIAADHKRFGGAAFKALSEHYERLLDAETTLFLADIGSRSRANDFYAIAQEGLRLQEGLVAAHRTLSGLAEYFRANEEYRIRSEVKEMQS